MQGYCCNTAPKQKCSRLPMCCTSTKPTQLVSGHPTLAAQLAECGHCTLPYSKVTHQSRYLALPPVPRGFSFSTRLFMLPNYHLIATTKMQKNENYHLTNSRQIANANKCLKIGKCLLVRKLSFVTVIRKLWLANYPWFPSHTPFLSLSLSLSLFHFISFLIGWTCSSYYLHEKYFVPNSIAVKDIYCPCIR